MGIKSEDSTLTSGGAGAAPSVPLCGADITDALLEQTGENGNHVSPPTGDDASLIVEGEFDAGLIAAFLNKRIPLQAEVPFSAARGLMDDLNAARAAFVNLDLSEELFAAIKHGDEDHQQWLHDKLIQFFAERTKLRRVGSSGALNAGSMHANPSASASSPSPKEER